MVKRRSFLNILAEVSAFLITIGTHWVVYFFIIVNAFKSRPEAARLSLAFPTEFYFIDNVSYILSYNNRVFLRALLNSLTITVSTIVILVFVSSMTAFVLQRRGGKLTKASDKMVLAGLIAPISVIPTYWMLRQLGLANTIPGLVLVEIASMFPFSTMLYKNYFASIPKEIDEAAIVDGCGGWKLFFHIGFPLIKPITAAIIVLRSVVVYNDFVNPMYFLSGSRSTTVQLVIYTFQSAFSTDWGRLFAAIVIVSLLPLLLFIVLNKRIMQGVTIGAVKG